MVKNWVWPVWPQDPKTDCISKMNIRNKLIICMLIQIQESRFSDFWVGLVKNGSGFLVHETPKSAVSSE